MTGSPNLLLFRSPRVEVLVDCLKVALTDVPADPMTPQRVAVGSRGMERWLRDQLASPAGVCANVAFPFLHGALLDGLSVLEGAPVVGPENQGPEAMAWAILAELQDPDVRGGLPEVLAYLQKEGGDPEPGAAISRRTWAWARALGDVLERYDMYRPDWVRAWSQTSPAVLPNPSPEPWQERLWKRVNRRLGARPLALRVQEARAKVENRQTVPELPPLHVFGISSFPPLVLETLGLLSMVGRVCLYCFTPSHGYMGDLRKHTTALKGLQVEERMSALEDLLAEGEENVNVLLANCGRLSRDFQVLMEVQGLSSQEPDGLLGEPGESPRCALHRLQRDVYDQQGHREMGEREPLAPADDSVQVHASHGPTRQVQVLRDALLCILDAHPDVQPRDVVIMTPDIETYAPLVEVEFRRGLEGRAPDGEFGAVGAPCIPLDVADRSLTSLNPVADALLRILALGDNRLTSRVALDLLAIPVVRTRFSLEEDHLAVLRRMVADAGICWGDDGPGRAREILGAQQAEGHALAAEDQNTWAFGLERLALALASSDEAGLHQGRLAAGPVEGDRVDALGAFLSFSRSLLAWRARLRQPLPVAAWQSRLNALLLDFTEVPANLTGLVGQVQERVAAVTEAAAAAGMDAPVTVGAIHHLLAGDFQVANRGDRRIGGAVTLCSMTPMRGVPFKVVCLLGLEDGVFPRTTRGLGVDGVVRWPRMGDRNPRDEDRHEFLEALMCARSHLLIVYGARDATNNSERPPCAPVAELLETLDGTFLHPEGPGVPAHRAFIVHHPLQPFSARNFHHAPDNPPRSHDASALRVARTLRGTQEEPDGLFGPRAAAAFLQTAPPRAIRLDSLVDYFQHPCKHLLRRRLSVSMSEYKEVVPEREPVVLDDLEKWKVGHDFFQLAHTHLPKEDGHRHAETMLRAKGVLPLAAGGQAYVDEAGERCRLLTEHLGGLRPLAPQDVSAQVGGVLVTGTLANLYADGVLRDVDPDKPDKPGRLLAAWLRLLLAGCCPASGTKSGLLLGTERNRKGILELASVNLSCPPQPGVVMGSLVALYLQGLQRPLRYACKTSHAFAEGNLKEGRVQADPVVRGRNAARLAWEGGEHSRGDVEDPDSSAVFGSLGPWEPDGPEDVVHPEFLEVAVTVWAPIFQSMTTSKRKER
jgi:exodeoxyribonuclease V gamma subunit